MKHEGDSAGVTGRPSRRYLVYPLLAVALLGVLALTWIYGAKLTYDDSPPIRSDGTDYYFYLPAVFLDHDITMDTTAKREQGGGSGSRPKVGGMVRVGPHDDLLDEVGIGEAVLLAPFFAGGHALAYATGASRDGFSWPYQLAVCTAALTYVLLGLAILGTILRRWFRAGVTIVTLLAITFGTNLFHYATYDASFSHAFSFFLVAATLRLALALWDRPRPVPAAGLGAALALVVLVRPTNLVIVLFCVLIGVESVSGLRSRAATLVRERKLAIVGGVVFALLLIPQFAYWHRITGGLIVFAYPDGQHLDFLRPHLVGVLISVRKGLFFWTPLALLSVVGLAFLRRSARPLVVPAIVYLAVDAWVIASWNRWSYGGSFGMRPFVEAMPVFALGLAALLDTIRGRATRWAVGGAVALSCLLSVHAMLAYWQKSLPLDHTTLRQYVTSFRHL